MAKLLRYGARILLGFLSLWLILLVSAYVLFSLNKAALTARANAFLNRRFQGKIHINNISLNVLSNFPYPAVQVNGVTVDDSVYAVRGQHTVYLERVRIVPGLKGLWRGRPVIRKVVVAGGWLYLYRGPGGYDNGYVWVGKQSRPPKDSTRPSLPFHVEFYRVELMIADSVRHKLYAFDFHRLLLDHNGTYTDSSTWRLDMDVTVHSLAFNTAKGGFLQDQDVRAQGTLGYAPGNRLLSFRRLALHIDRQALLADGDFRFDTTRSFRLRVSAPSLVFASGRSWLTPKIQRKLAPMRFDKALAVEATIEGFMTPGDEPRILVRWTVAHNTVTGFIGTVEDCSFTGFFNNHVNDSLSPGDANSTIRADSLVGKYEGSIPFKTRRLEILRLDTAILAFDLSIHDTVPDWGDLLQGEDLSFDKGRVDVDLRGHYPLSDSSGVSPDLDGRIDLRDVVITYEPRNVVITGGQAHLRLEHQDLLLERISGYIGKSPLVISGAARHFLALAATDTGKMVLDWHVYSPALDGMELLHFLGKGGHRRTAGKAARGAVGEATRGAPPDGSFVGHMIDRYAHNCRIHTGLRVDQLTYKNFVATGVDAAVVLDKGVFSLQHLDLHTAKGSLDATGSIRPFVDDNLVRFNATFSHIDLPSLFRDFDDFGQASLSARNLAGTLNARADLSIRLTDKGHKIPGSLDGTLRFAITDGALLGFTPLTRLSSFALKNRDLSNIYFSRLYDTFRFSRDTLVFDRMEIQSTVLDMFVAGAYKLDGSYTDADIQIPFTNLKKQKGLPDNAGAYAHHGPSLFVHAFNRDGEPLHYKFGLFRKKVPGVRN
ncbi:AsmA family protein [Dinghuibacter silviterrae]|uniref:AsmA-like protein n=1 Tax=Dinghuibacter silviterrae TaxID=1539049 RepID=A0A4V3GLH9_9BACT|nr:AsmA-like C-terminal region-containing protein [Dinghuibacter silviterrae]TDW99612.1 AsmA-like protein [Dinghuibacter silviterrae]